MAANHRKTPPRKIQTYRYHAYGLVLQSALRLDELLPAPRANAEVFFKPVDRFATRCTDWFHRVRLRRGKVWLCYGRIGQGYALRFPGQAEFRLSQDGRLIEGCATGATPADFRHLLLDQVFPLALTVHGRTVLHASVMRGPWGTVAFLGATGAGKSTLAAALVKQDWQLVADDVLCLTWNKHTPLAWPSYPGLRLWPDTRRRFFPRLCAKQVADYSPKLRVVPRAPSARPTRPCKLAGIYVLKALRRSGVSVRVQPLHPQAAFWALHGGAFRLALANPRLQRQEFKTLCRLATSLPFVGTLEFKRGYAGLRGILHALTTSMHCTEDPVVPLRLSRQSKVKKVPHFG